MSSTGFDHQASTLSVEAQGIDHLAIAVLSLDESIEWFTNVLGFSLKERRRTDGVSTGMISAVLEAGPLQIVLLQGTDAESQVSKFVDQYGPGVQHIAIRVNDIESVTKDLKQKGLEFDTSIIQGGGLKQAFSKRDQGTGLMLELIERGTSGFQEQNISELFSQLEAKKVF